MREIDFDEVAPDKNAHWLHLTDNDFETFLPLASKETKAAKTAAGEKAIFKLFSLGVVTNRDEWVYDLSQIGLQNKMEFFTGKYNENVITEKFNDNIK